MTLERESVSTLMFRLENITCAPISIHDNWPKVYGIQTKWSVTAALFAYHEKDSDCVYVYREYTGKNMTPQEHAKKISELEPAVEWTPGMYDLTESDDLSGLYHKAGLRTLTKVNALKEEGLMEVLQRLQNSSLKVFDTCPKTLQELDLYRDRNSPHKGSAPLVDCLRYIVQSGLEVACGKPFPDFFYKQTPGYV